MLNNQYWIEKNNLFRLINFPLSALLEDTKWVEFLLITVTESLMRKKEWNLEFPNLVTHLQRHASAIPFCAFSDFLWLGQKESSIKLSIPKLAFSWET